MRIVSLVPNATEILFALGAGDLVVGVSHECDFPPEVEGLPQLTGSALTPDLGASAIDRAVGSQLASGESLYTLDEERIEALEPTLIITQTLCPVCAVSTAQVNGAVAPLGICPEVISLDPNTLEDVFGDIHRVATALGLPDEAASVTRGLRSRIEAVRRIVAGRASPRVVALEWLDPPFIAGHWIPEMIAIAGGDDALARPGDASRKASWKLVGEADPDILIAMPCGFDRQGSIGQLERIAGAPGWSKLRAVGAGRVHAVDANGCFSRPGPRLVDGIETLARCFHES